jgi:thioredoxin-like negative regulator of GroEL
MEALKGKPLLVSFWAVSCHICHENMPKLQT